jgi:hypothetical protein
MTENERRINMVYLSRRRGFCILRVAAVFFMLTVGQSWAGGGQHYPNGVEDFAVGALPPPGVYLINYLLLVQKNGLRDDSGNNVLPSFKASVVAEVPRLVYVTPYTLLGGSYAVHMFLPTYSAEVNAGTAPGAKDIVDSSDKGLGDIIFSPLVLGWHFGPNLHTVFAVDIWAPTGNYEKTRPASQILSKNHWTIEPVIAASYFWKGFDISGKFMYDFNTSNDDFLKSDGTTGKLDPGQEFHIDWAVDYSFKNGISTGLVGYNYWQTSEDEVDGVKVANQDSQVGGIGVGVKYWPNKGPFSMVLKQYWEYAAKNIATGPQTQFKIIYAF